MPSAARRLHPPGFIAPCLPTLTREVPEGPQWSHEIKHKSASGILRSFDRTGDVAGMALLDPNASGQLEPRPAWGCLPPNLLQDLHQPLFLDVADSIEELQAAAQCEGRPDKSFSKRCGFCNP
jgi:hypothetical protein